MGTQLVPIVFAGTLLATGFVAQEPSDAVKWAGTGRVAIASTVIVPNGCYSAGKPRAGAPAGATVVEHAALVTFPLVHADGVMCTQALQPVEFSITIDAPPGTQAIVIYTTDPVAKSVSARALALPRR
jgi:hypothetical protein